MSVDYFLKIEGIQGESHGSKHTRARSKSNLLAGVRPRPARSPTAAAGAPARSRCRTSTS